MSASHLHRHLTVAFANAADRSRLAQLIGSGPGTRVIGADDLLPVVESLARERSASRLALRACLDTVAGRTMHDYDIAQQELEQLLHRHRTVLEGAEWATRLQSGLVDQLASVETARELLDQQRAGLRSAQQDLDKVLGQRKAAATAIEEADAQLAEMGDLGMDEGGLRRGLEAAGQAVQAAQGSYAKAVGQLEDLQLERAALGPVLIGPNKVDPAAVAAVQSALEDLESSVRFGAVDPRAASLASELEELAVELAASGGSLFDSADELTEAQRRVDAAAAELAQLDATNAHTVLTAEQRAAIDAAHVALDKATDQFEHRSSSGARKRLAQAQEAERALLDQHGFGSYLEVVLTGGRAGTADPARAQLERELFDASRARDALQRRGQATPELERLRAERTRLLALSEDLLGVDPGDQVIALLHTHQPVGTGLQIHLRQALAAAGVRPVGMSLADAAHAFLASHPLPELGDPLDQAARQARLVGLDEEIGAAQAEVERTAEALQMAERAVGTFETELSERSEEDVQRYERYTAAQELRAQITAVAATLRKAEVEARHRAAEAHEQVAAAEADFDRIATEVSALAERGRLLADALPGPQRLDGDPLSNLPLLVQRLREHAGNLHEEIQQAEATVANATNRMEEAMTARRSAGPGDGPMPEDFVEALEQVVDAEPMASLVIFDEPFGDPGDQGRFALLERVRGLSASHQTVLLTEDPEVLGWAIDLPADEVAADPADVLLARLVGEETLNPGGDSVDVTSTDSDPDFETAPRARRWAGRR
jgi:hypothetical protein